MRVFISYARRDGATLARRLQPDHAETGLDAWLDTQQIPGGAFWSVTIERGIDTRQVTFVLLSPGSDASEICRAEQLRALDKGNRVIPDQGRQPTFVLWMLGNIATSPTGRHSQSPPSTKGTELSHGTICLA